MISRMYRQYVGGAQFTCQVPSNSTKDLSCSRCWS